MRSLLRRISARDEGFTLVELMTASALLMMVMGAMFGSFVSMQRFAAREVARSESTDSVRIAMDRMTKEVRQATTVRSTSDASTLDMDTYVGGVSTHVIYDVVGTDLQRTVAGDTITLAQRLTGSSVFSYSVDPSTGQQPSVVTISLEVHPEKFSTDEAVTAAESQVRLRNR